MSELRECPFCGNKNIKASVKGIECSNCVTVKYGMADNELETMIKGWNTRHTPKHETVEELHKTIVRLSEQVIGEYGYCMEEGCNFDEIYNEVHDDNCMIKKSIDWLAEIEE